MTVVALTASEKNHDRFTVGFDDGSELKVQTAQVADFSLYKGRELSDEEYEELCGEAGLSHSKARALSMLGRRSMSRGELVAKLRAKGDSGDTAEKAADRMEELGVLHDGEYASVVVRHYAAKGYGIAKIRDELYRRKIDKELWDKALEEAGDFEKSAGKYLAQKLRGRTPDADELRRAAAALYRRGFSCDDIRSAISEYAEYADGLEEA